MTRAAGNRTPIRRPGGVSEKFGRAHRGDFVFAAAVRVRDEQRALALPVEVAPEDETPAVG